MAEFYGGVEGNRGPATRMGSRSSGFRAYAQSNNSRITVDYGHHTPQGEEGRTIAHFTIGGGWSTYYRGGTISFHPDEVAEALDTRDPKILAIWKRIENEFNKLDAEAPKAIKRFKNKQRSGDSPRYRIA
jgi:hypothetical protein